MALRQIAVEHDFVSKFAGGFNSYDVITPWPNMTRLIFNQTSCKGSPIGFAKPERTSPNGPGPTYREKKLRVRGCTNRLPVRGLMLGILFIGSQVTSHGLGFVTCYT